LTEFLVVDWWLVNVYFSLANQVLVNPLSYLLPLISSHGERRNHEQFFTSQAKNPRNKSAFGHAVSVQPQTRYSSRMKQILPYYLVTSKTSIQIS
jgi:hypothetical protein